MTDVILRHYAIFNNDGTKPVGVGLKIQLASDASGNYVPVVALDSGGVTIGSVSPYLVTPTAGTTSTIATGGTAITAITGPINGGYITNPVNSTAQGIVTAENAYLDMVGTPGSTDAAAIGTTILLLPGQNFSLPGLASGVHVKLNAATTGHQFTVVVW